MGRGEIAGSAASVASRLGGGLVDARLADVGLGRERVRLRRLRKVAIVLGPVVAWLWYRVLTGRPLDLFQLPSLPGDPLYWVLPVVLILAIGVLVAMPLMSGRSPHVLVRPEQIDVTFDDVKGLGPIVDEVIKTLNTFLGHATYRERLGGTPRRGLLFEGPPGTGKTHLAKAMAREAGVPFLFVSATSFQSMWYGATARKIRSYFKQLRKVAQREGGAIGFIEEIDAIATTRGGMNATPLDTVPSRLTSGCQHASVALATAGLGEGVQVHRAGVSESTGGVVNELLVQLQSFDTPPLAVRLRNAGANALNAFLPAHRQLKVRKPGYNNILVVAATNRADSLDPALRRPGRFDRCLSFDLPSKEARRELIDHFLTRKSHHAELDTERQRDQLATQTFGYTPVMIEHLLDEALIHALRNGRDAFTWEDVEAARLTEEVGLKNPVEYTERERLTVATHEAGHATVAYLAGTRRLEVLSIVKRRGSLGLLAHGDLDEVYTRSRSEMFALVEIAMGGMAAEEIWFGEAGTGPGGDLAYATKVAAEIVGSAGMGSSLVSLAAVEAGALNNTNLVGRALSDPVLRPEMDDVLARAKVRARAMLAANRHIVEALRDALLERDELIGDEITDVIDSAGPAVRGGWRFDQRKGERRRRDVLTTQEA